MLRKSILIIALFFALILQVIHPAIGFADDIPVKIADPALEKAIRDELKIPKNDLLASDLMNLQSLFPQAGDKIKT